MGGGFYQIRFDSNPQLLDQQLTNKLGSPARYVRFSGDKVRIFNTNSNNNNGVFSLQHNAQATTHLSNAAFWGLDLPVTVPGRVTGIWRSYINQRIMKDVGLHVSQSCIHLPLCDMSVLHMITFLILLLKVIYMIRQKSS
jgi:hypothetical protein